MAWRCQRDGACCTEPAEVVVTVEEQQALRAAAPAGIVLTFLTHPDPRFVRLRAKPCPLYDDRARACRVYQVRPMNCRRFACLREDYTQPFDRVQYVPLTRPERRQLEVIQRHAQRWGRSHGWGVHG